MHVMVIVSIIGIKVQEKDVNTMVMVMLTTTVWFNSIQLNITLFIPQWSSSILTHS